MACAQAYKKLGPKQLALVTTAVVADEQVIPLASDVPFYQTIHQHQSVRSSLAQPRLQAGHTFGCQTAPLFFGQINLRDAVVTVNFLDPRDYRVQIKPGGLLRHFFLLA
ncbi:MAG: hypothetical protein AAB871_00965 [Patescibacteria group bacterium]